MLEKVDLQCIDCGEDARSPRGTIFIRTQPPNGRWGNASICDRCWYEKHPDLEPVRVTLPGYRKP